MSNGVPANACDPFDIRTGVLRGFNGTSDYFFEISDITKFASYSANLNQAIKDLGNLKDKKTVLIVGEALPFSSAINVDIIVDSSTTTLLWRQRSVEDRGLPAFGNPFWFAVVNKRCDVLIKAVT